MLIDLHIHSSVSDGTDAPALLLEHLRTTGIQIFSLTDHDDVLGCEMIDTFLQPGDPLFIPGVELSAEHQGEKYHILGYAFNSSLPVLSALTGKVHDLRIRKISELLSFIQEEYGFCFSEEDTGRLLKLPNPGKPHVSRLMMKYGYVSSISDGINSYLDRHHSSYRDISPEEAIHTILEAGGLPVLAHGLYGDGRQSLTEKELASRVGRLKELGLVGVECYYSGYSPEDQRITRRVCEAHDLLATAGSDYHGQNKKVALGETHLANAKTDPRVISFLNLCRDRLG